MSRRRADCVYPGTHANHATARKERLAMKLTHIFTARAPRIAARTVTSLFTRMAIQLALFVGVATQMPFAIAQPGTLDIATYGPYSGLAYGRFPDTSAHFFRLLDAIVLPNDQVVAGGACIATGATPAGTRFCIAVWSLNGALVSLYVHSTLVNRVSADAGGAIAAQPDGKIVVTAPCIYQPTGTITQFCTVRFNADFTPDTTFAVGFQNVSPSPSVSGNNSYVNAIAIQPDGKIVLGGQCSGASGTSFCADRRLADGTPDSSFGFGGSSMRTFLGVSGSNTFDRVKRVAVAPDGKIYLGGDCKRSNGFTAGCYARLNADGTIDNAFLSVATTPKTFLMGNGVSSETIYDMVVQANNEFVFAGDCKNPSSTTTVPCAVRFSNPDSIQFYAGTDYLGAVAPTPSGYVLREPAADGAFSIVRAYLQPDGKMLVLLKDQASSTNFRVRRYNEDGSIDANWRQPAFDFNAATDNASGFAVGLALGQERSGKVIAMGYTESLNSTNPQARVIRLDNRKNPGHNCSADIDGDGKVLPTTDGLLIARASLGMTGSAVIAGAVGLGAARPTWPLIRDFLITQCGMNTVRP